MSAGRRSGLSLVEVSISLAILSIVLAGVFSALASSQRAGGMAREEQAASEEALRQLDLVLSNPSFDAVLATPAYGFSAGVATGQVDGGGQPVTVALAAAPAAFFDPGADPAAFAGHVRVVQNPDAEVPPSNDLIEVRVTVAWRGGDGAPQRVDVVSRRAR